MEKPQGRKDGIKAMTIKEFADKYGVAYNIVYEATYKVPCYSTMRKDREYSEEKLFKEVDALLTARMEKHRKLYHQTQRAFIRMNAVRKGEMSGEMPVLRKCSAGSSPDP